MHTAEAKLHHRLARYGYGPTATPRPTVIPTTRWTGLQLRYAGRSLCGPGFIGRIRGLRVRLQQALDPPALLVLEADSDLVTITEDQLPPRDYRLGEDLSASMSTDCPHSATWSHDAFVMNPTTAVPARRTDTYEVNPATVP